MAGNISLKLIKDLREKSGVGIVDCKKALEESNGNVEKALNILRTSGILKAGKKIGRDTREGVISSYIHQNNKLGSLVEIDCETDFVAKTDVFKDFAYNIAIQVVGMNPLYISRDEVPEDIIKEEEELILNDIDVKNKPQEIKKNICKGKIDKFYSEICLLDQVYYKDTSFTIMDLVNDIISKVGENVRIRRFIRFEIDK